jgi:hypothetical protein
MSRWSFAVLLTAWLCACSSTRNSSEVLGSQHLGEDSDRYIIAGVENDAATFIAHAGSTPRGYDGLDSYGPSPHATQLLKGIERDYGLREINAWPIPSLHMHCAVLELPANANRSSVLAALTADKRVRIAQPLQSFVTRIGTKYSHP